MLSAIYHFRGVCHLHCLHPSGSLWSICKATQLGMGLSSQRQDGMVYSGVSQPFYSNFVHSGGEQRRLEDPSWRWNDGQLDFTRMLHYTLHTEVTEIRDRGDKVQFH